MAGQKPRQDAMRRIDRRSAEEDSLDGVACSQDESTNGAGYHAARDGIQPGVIPVLAVVVSHAPRAG